MKNLTMIVASAMVLALTQMGHTANVGDPEEVNVKVFAMWATLNADCSDMTEVFSSDSAEYKNVHGSPNFGTGRLTNGTYQCMAIRMSDIIKFKPAYTSDDGNCVQSVESTIEVFRLTDDITTSVCPDGTTVDATDGEDNVCVYFSANGSTSSNADAFNPPGFKIENAWSVNGAASGTLVTNFNGKIQDSFGRCDAQPPTWSFR